MGHGFSSGFIKTTFAIEGRQADAVLDIKEGRILFISTDDGGRFLPSQRALSVSVRNTALAAMAGSTGPARGGDFPGNDGTRRSGGHHTTVVN